MPLALATKVELFPDLARYLSAFYRLSAARQAGMAVGPIQLAEVLAYCDIWDIPRQERVDFAEVIGKLDGEWLTMIRSQRKHQ